MKGADLKGADLNGADLNGADLNHLCTVDLVINKHCCQSARHETSQDQSVSMGSETKSMEPLALGSMCYGESRVFVDKKMLVVASDMIPGARSPMETMKLLTFCGKPMAVKMTSQDGATDFNLVTSLYHFGYNFQESCFSPFILSSCLKGDRIEITVTKSRSPPDVKFNISLSDLKSIV